MQQKRSHHFTDNFSISIDFGFTLSQSEVLFPSIASYKHQDSNHVQQLLPVQDLSLQLF